MFQFNGAVNYCDRCKPESDPVGVGMFAEYAAKMRAHLAEERASAEAGAATSSFDTCP